MRVLTTYNPTYHEKTTLLFLLISIPFVSISQVSSVVTELSDPFDVVIQGTDAYVAEFTGNTIVRVDLNRYKSYCRRCCNRY
ncbi:hypothetical protein [uncultured Dokdonia sp.]|uniref:hypothetical protein n=1 Tax=uncultured Dokdonia sp. TaxID=575653 RepID=UPI0026336526|nr:hypothetical protein [uncultured Dokdonia sp.]